MNQENESNGRILALKEEYEKEENKLLWKMKKEENDSFFWILKGRVRQLQITIKDLEELLK